MSNYFQCPFPVCGYMNIRDRNLVTANGLIHCETCFGCEQLIYICKECNKCYEHHVNFGKRGLCFACVGQLATASELLDEQAIDSGHPAFSLEECKTPERFTIQISSPTASPSPSTASSSMSDFDCPSPMMFHNHESIDDLYDDTIDVGSDGDEEENDDHCRDMSHSVKRLHMSSDIRSYLKLKIVIGKDQAIDLTYNGPVIKMIKSQAIDLSDSTSPKYSATSPSYIPTSPTCAEEPKNWIAEPKAYNSEDEDDFHTPVHRQPKYVEPVAPKRGLMINSKNRSFQNPEEVKEARRLCQEAGQAIDGCEVNTIPTSQVRVCSNCQAQRRTGSEDSFRCPQCLTDNHAISSPPSITRISTDQITTIVKKTVKRKRRSELDDLREGAMNLL